MATMHTKNVHIYGQHSSATQPAHPLQARGNRCCPAARLRPHRATPPTTTNATSPATPSSTTLPPNYLSNIKHRPDLSRATDDPIPPWGSKITGLLPLPGGVWCLRQNWIDLPFTVDLALNSFVFTLRSGGLLVGGPGLLG